jgi:hypothetical protein
MSSFPAFNKSKRVCYEIKCLYIKLEQWVKFSSFLFLFIQPHFSYVNSNCDFKFKTKLCKYTKKLLKCITQCTINTQRNVSLYEDYNSFLFKVFKKKKKKFNFFVDYI